MWETSVAGALSGKVANPGEEVQGEGGCFVQDQKGLLVASVTLAGPIATILATISPTVSGISWNQIGK